ncbi:hypothetical protein MCHI_001132, partial [Candidatus Magnetoovum chiemensis]
YFYKDNESLNDRDYDLRYFIELGDCAQKCGLLNAFSSLGCRCLSPEKNNCKKHKLKS